MGNNKRDRSKALEKCLLTWMCLGWCTERWDTWKRDRDPSQNHLRSAKGQPTIRHLDELQPNPELTSQTPPGPVELPGLPRRDEQS